MDPRDHPTLPQHAQDPRRDQARHEGRQRNARPFGREETLPHLHGTGQPNGQGDQSCQVHGVFGPDSEGIKGCFRRGHSSRHHPCRKTQGKKEGCLSYLLIKNNGLNSLLYLMKIYHEEVFWWENLNIKGA